MEENGDKDRDRERDRIGDRSVTLRARSPMRSTISLPEARLGGSQRRCRPSAAHSRQAPGGMAAAVDVGALAMLSRDPLTKKVIQVTLWLKKIYGDVPIPEYEVNESTVDILHEVMECNEETDKDIMLLIGDMKDRTTKYEAEAEYWQDILGESLGLFVDSLSQEATTDLTDMVESAMELDVKDTSLTSFYNAISYMTSELYKTKSRNREMEMKSKILTEKLTSAVNLEKQSEEDVKNLEKSQEAEKAKAELTAKKMKFLRDKSKDLKIRICDAEAELLARGLDQSTMHEPLEKLSKELAAMLKEIEPLKKEVASYHDLPPSIPLARVKVEEARRELKWLDDELTREIEALPFELT